MKKETVKLEKDNLIHAYNSGCSETKETLRWLYPNVEFEKKLAESWDEYCEMFKDTPYVIDVYEKVNIVKGNCPTISAELRKYTSLRKLELLRDHYNGDWKADWENMYNKHVILKRNNVIDRMNYKEFNQFLSFKTSDLRDKFLTNFKDLIEQAKDLI